jgi:hypothetical protein
MHLNIGLAEFTLNHFGSVDNLAIYRNTIDYLPLPIKRIIHYPESYVECMKNNMLIINEEGTGLFDIWLHSRIIPANRENLKLYLQKATNTLKLMLDSHSCSLTDCYWTREYNESIDWDKVKLFNSNKIETVYEVENRVLSGKGYTAVNSTLGGQLEKFWYKSIDSKTNEQKLMLAKKTDIQYNILNVREIIASKIYKEQHYSNYVHYKYVRNRYKQIIGCKCRVFTNEKLELITAYDLLEEYNDTQKSNVYELITERAVAYGASRQQIINQLDLETLVDYIITNRDRHQGNIAFLRDPNTLRIKVIAPIFDSGSSKHLEAVLPEGVKLTKVNNLYNTELDVYIM